MKRAFTLIELMIIMAIIGIVAAIAIPNMIEARKHANEASAIGSLRSICTAESVYRERSVGNVFGSFEDLYNATLIDEVLSSGTKQGYRYTLTPDATHPQYLFAATANPAINGQTGDRYFFIDNSGVIRFNTGGVASASSSALGGR